MKEIIKEISDIMFENIKVVYLCALILVALTMMVVIFILPTAYSQTYINPGICYAREYTTYNSTSNTTINQSMSVCANNCTQSFSVINITLYPGDNRYYNGSNYNLTARCDANITYANKCIIESGNVDPGETFNFQSAVCDISIEADECQEVENCGEGIPTTYEEKYRFRYSNISGRVQLDFAGNERIWNLDDNIDISGALKYTCPTSIINNTAAIATAEQCHALGEIYCGDAFDLMVDLKEKAEGKRYEYENKLENCRLELNRIQENKVCLSNDELAQLKAENIIVNNETESCSQVVGMLEWENKEVKNDRTALIMSTLFCIAGWTYTYYNGRKAGKASKLGGA